MSIFKAHVAKRVLNLSVLDYLNQGVNILFSVIFVRAVGADMYGLFKYLLAILEIPDIFINQLDKTSLRFNVELDLRGRINLLFFNLKTRLKFSVPFFLGVFVYFAFIKDKALWFPDSWADLTFGLLVLTLSIAWTFAQSINSTLSTFVTSMDRAEINQVLNLVSSVITLILGAILYFAVDTEKYKLIILFISMRLLITIGMVVYNVYWIHKNQTSVKNLFKIAREAASPSTMQLTKEMLKGYALPLQLNTIIGWLKDRIAVFLLGSAGEMAAVGHFEIIRTLYNFPKKFFPRLMNLLLPRAVKSYQNSKDEFKKKFKELFLIQFVFALVSGLGIILLSPYILKAYNLPHSKSLFLFIWIYAINLLCSAVSNANNFLIEINNKAVYLLQAAVVRIILVIPLTIYFTKVDTTLGAAVAVTVSTFGANILLTHLANKLDNQSMKLNLIYSVLTLLLVYASIPLIEMFYGIDILWKDFILMN